MATYPPPSSSSSCFTFSPFNDWNRVAPSPSSSCSYGGNSMVPMSSASASAIEQALRHIPGVAVEWNLEEQAILEDGLARFAGVGSNVTVYATIAQRLQDKTVRDVAFRVRWMKENKESTQNSKRRKDDLKLSKKNRNRKEKVSGRAVASSRLAARPDVASAVPRMATVKDIDCVSYKAIGGPIGTLMEQNAQAFNRISKNLASRSHGENIEIFHQARENFNKIMKNLNETPDSMSLMPPLPKLLELHEMEDLSNRQTADTSMFQETDFALL
ncbi:hypothetical protein PIB30_094057 [Stylosanthes scabra]|uniref:Uncharacterized protein n=1 Tax=Stylosanthes scabra TaxID=79078 RepID=A0ABU6VTU7_9FABA|nr:hypothetical protein [Stylosanthes scabra]